MRKRDFILILSIALNLFLLFHFLKTEIYFLGYNNGSSATQNKILSDIVSESQKGAVEINLASGQKLVLIPQNSKEKNESE